MRTERRRTVAVTGIGVVSPIGVGLTAFWDGLYAGTSGIGPIADFSVAARAPSLAATVRGFAPRDLISATHLRRMDKLSRMVVAAGRLAVDAARISLTDVAADRVAVAVGSAFGNTNELDQHLRRIYSKGLGAASPLTFPNLVLNAPASYLAMELGLTGANLTLGHGEVSGEMAVLTGIDLLRSERADVVLAGGGDEFNALIYDAYRRARALSSQRGGREWASPYDVNRNGLVLGEGAAMLVLETTDRARARGAHIHAEIEAGESFAIASPLYDWAPDTSAAIGPLQELVAGAGVELVCGAANGSPHLDASELALLARLFEDGEPSVWLTSIKGATGEFGAAGALTLAAAALAIDAQGVPPLCQLETPPSPAPCRFAPRTGTPARIDRALCVSLARGGASAAILLRRPTH